MAMFSKFTLVTDPVTGQEVEFGTLSKSAQQQILAADEAATAQQLGLYSAASQNAGTAVNREASPVNDPVVAPALPEDPPVTDGDQANELAATQSDEEPISDEESDIIDSSDNSPTEDDVADFNARHAADEEDASNESASPESKSQLGESTTSVAASSDIEKPTPTRNPLHSYATYTYGITLSVLSKDAYKSLVNGELKGAWQPTYSLISSGGGEHSNRSKFFHDDFYFENLKMTTIIGPSSQSRNTNAIDLSFTIVEPYGITLLDRIIDVCADPKVNGKNYLQQPYLLEINFFGADSLGKQHSKIHELQKRIPIKLLEMKIRVTAKGTEYAMKAIPFNHGALLESVNSTPANFEIKATKVSDFFNGMDQSEMAKQIQQKNQARSDAILAAGITKDDDGNDILPPGQRVGLGGDEKALAAAEKTINAPYSVKSFPGAYNAWQQSAVDGAHVAVANQIKFEFDPALDSEIVDPTKVPLYRSKMTVADKASEQGKDTATSSKTPTNDFDPKTMSFNISSGTSVVDVINMVMRNSKYIKDQVVDPLTDKNTLPTDTTVKYYKIVPKVELLDFDDKRNEYAKLTTFYVKKYDYYNSKSPNLPVAKPKGAVKEYNYIYTGKNIDILEFSLDFDTAYYTTVVVNREKTEATSGAANADSGDASKDNLKNQPTHNDRVAKATTQPVSADAQATSTNADSAKAVLVANATKSIAASSRGDMLNVKLKILGDPHFIKQDDVYANPGHSDYADTKTLIMPGTLNMDRVEIFCKINFTTPVDMDDKTGLTRKDSRYTNAGFSGYYKILTVESEFSKGQFIQTLDCIRVFDQDTPNEQERAQSKAEKARRDFAQTDPRLINQQTDDEDPFEAMRKQNEEQEDEPIDVDELFDTPNEDAGQDDDNNSEDTNASDEGQAIADDLFDAPEIDVDTQIAEDNSSSEPQNPFA